ncbi:unnamed protein product [Adineta steineri]|uniref:Uncharacterized protein n=1 Tax=Adineta steineri TaxID=433720 RepID=A0A815FTV9_9BILA|nr:unnamed protein product [Adineta steineri]CAF3714530.1 unnamed protein product [Adineta steineri]
MDSRDSETDSKNSEQSSSSSSSSTVTNKTSWWNKYKWHMRHYFYIHIFIFISMGLLGGLAVVIIENYLKPNRLMHVRYIDAWFIASSCVYGCGLSTLDFARLSTYSQVILMIFTLACGMTISTLPALIVKAQTHKHERGLMVDNDHLAYHTRAETTKKIEYSYEAEVKIARLPNAEQLRYRAYLCCLALIPLTCITIYLAAFAFIGCWIKLRYRPNQLKQDGRPVNPWYASFIITVTGFNQNGLTPWSDNLMRFVDDTILCIFVMLLIMSGNAFFPFIFRNVIMLIRRLVSWHHKIIFDYISLNNHRLSTVLYPTIQTRIYLTVTFCLYALGIIVSMILDYHSQSFIHYSAGQRILIFVFHTISSRFAGFQTIDITLLAEGTLVIYLLLMAVKPQMLCALDKTPFELEWETIRDKETIYIEATRRQSAELIDDSSSIESHVLPIRYLHRILRSHSLDARRRAQQHFASLASLHRSPSLTRKKAKYKLRLLMFLIARRMLSHLFTFLTRTRTWLFIFIFLICTFESYHMTPIDENVTVFKILFEVVSAFGAVGLTTGYPNLKSSFATVLSVPSKIILVLTMLMGRHRGLLDSMKDQEKIEYSAYTLLERWKRKARDEHPLLSSNDSISTPSPPPPQVKPRTFSTNRPSRSRYIIELSKPNIPPRTKPPVY